uniref:DNA topoisomerase 1 n=1 Tax=Norrisiella sphaerica TaxID=552664 RepID=A0A7S2QUZ6_9EUKA
MTPEQEEVATFYAVLIESDHAEKKVFRDNFFKAWKKILGPGHVIKDFDKCDFRPIWKYSQEKKEEAKIYRKENREKLKKEKEELMEIYGYALVDGYREKIGNFRVEPPGLFRGRGQHPKTGRLKERVMPEQITLNIGKGAKIPKCPIEGHNWKGVIHNPNVTWLAFWKDNINGDFKYVWLDKSSKFKGQSDFLKYEKSRKLKDYIDKIRAFYNRGIKSNKTEDYELAVAIYLIDRLALRVGNEKGEDTADTVGCCSLRTAHIMFKCDESDPPITLEDTKIRLKFLGKDSIQYDNIVNVEAPFYKKLMLMKKQALKTVDRMRDKKEREKGANMFTKVDPSVVNTTLSSFMDGLTAKVFRTYNASITLQRELEKVDDEVSKETPIGDKVFVYNRSNRIVAELCNHQRAIPKSHSTQVGKMKEKMSDLLDKREALEEHIQVLKGKKKKKAKKEKKNKKGEKEPRKFSQNIDVCQRQLESCLKSITNLEARLKTKDETKAVSLGTSKINYMDPRITVAWCKRKELPLEKVFNASLVTKFPWAMDTKTDWKY